MRVLGAADIHLDSPMSGLAAYDGAPVDRLRLAARRALGNLVDTAIDEDVALVLLAGDVFNGDWHDIGTGLHFVRAMGRLREAGIPVVSIAGNHDAESKLMKGLSWPANVHFLDTRKPQTVVFDELGIAVHGQGYRTPAVYEDLSATYPEPVGDMINVGLLHTSADGRPGHERYAPCSLERLRQHGYEYWALGHIHHREVLSEEPLIVFPGNLQGRGLRETGPKGATLVEFADDGSLSFEHRVLDCVRWERIEIDAGRCATRDDICEAAAEQIRELLGDVGDRLLAARVVISGRSDAHVQLAANVERLRDEVTAAAIDVAGDQIWIERVQLSTSAPRAIAEGGDDAVGQLVCELTEVTADEQALAEVSGALRPLADALPPAVLAQFNPLDLVTVRELMADVERSLPVALMERASD